MRMSACVRLRLFNLYRIRLVISERRVVVVVEETQLERTQLR